MNKLQQIQAALSLLDLSDMEITIYLDLIRLGSSPASLIARRLKLNRSTARYTLENLAKKRFIFQENRNGTYFFTAEDPEKILLLIQSEQREIELKESAVSQIIGDLKSMKNPHVNIPKVRFFEGVDGIIKMYEEVLKANTTIYGYSKTGDDSIHPEIIKYFKDRYRPQRKKLKNKAFMLHNSKNSEIYHKHGQAMNRITLYVPECFMFSTCFHIYNNRVCFYSRSTTDLSGVIMENVNIAKGTFSMFRLAWNFAKSLPENREYQNIII